MSTATAAIREITAEELGGYGAEVPPASMTTELEWFARQDGGALAVVRRDHNLGAYEFLALVRVDGRYGIGAHRTGISDHCAACSQAVAALEDVSSALH
jgi:hypothetical protein